MVSATLCLPHPLASFEERLSNRLHTNIVTKIVKLPSSTSSTSPLESTTTSLASAAPSGKKKGKRKAVSEKTTPGDKLQAILDTAVPLASMTEEDQIIIRGTHHKHRILQEYQDKYSTSGKAIVTRKKGKILSDLTDVPTAYPTVPPTARMRPRLTISYGVIELTR